MIQIKVPCSFFGTSAFEQVSDYCAHFGCKLLPRQKTSMNYTIETGDALNIFYMGLNLNFRQDNGITMSIASNLLGAAGSK